MDGTLVDVSGIRHFVESETRRDFDSFHSASIDCPVNEEVRQFLLEGKRRGSKLIIVTARSERWSFITSLWLHDHGIDADAILMRKRADYRPDHTIKMEFARGLAVRYEVVVAIDDRDDIVAVWREAGFSTMKVSPGGKLGPILPSLARKSSPLCSDLMGVGTLTVG